MSSQFQIDNSGIGGTPFLTFGVDTTANRDFTQSDLDSGLTACVVSDSNEIGMGAAGDKLFGKVVWVSQELQDGTTIPALCAVQARGVARFKYAATAPVRQSDGGGGRCGQSAPGLRRRRHRRRRALDARTGHRPGRGNSTCDVWLG